MLLCIDIGNTNIKFGLYKGEKLVTHWRIFTDTSKLADEYAVLLLSLFASESIRKEDIRGCAISSVVPDLTIAFHDLVKRHLDLEAVIVGQAKKPILRINTDNPKEVGPDLIANAVGAISLYGTPVIVIGFGTATTFSAVSKDKVFEGVAIAPGIGTGADALFDAGAMLPAVDLHRPDHMIGKNTILSLQSGLIYGFAGLVEGIVARMKEEHVAIIPGSAFGAGGEGFARACYATGYDQLEEALERIERFVGKL